MDLIAILIVTPISDRFHHHRAIFFSAAVCIQITGLLTTTFAPHAQPWARYGGLLMVGFGAPVHMLPPVFNVDANVVC